MSKQIFIHLPGKSCDVSIGPMLTAKQKQIQNKQRLVGHQVKGRAPGVGVARQNTHHKTKANADKDRRYAAPAARKPKR